MPRLVFGSFLSTAVEAVQRTEIEGMEGFAFAADLVGSIVWRGRQECKTENEVHNPQAAEAQDHAALTRAELGSIYLYSMEWLP